MRQQAGAEIGGDENLVEPHLGIVGRAEHNVGFVNDEFPVEPSSDDAICIRAIALEVERVEPEVCLDTMPSGVVEEDFPAVMEPAVVASLERALCEPVRRVVVLDVLGREAKLGGDWFNVQRERRGRARGSSRSSGC
jgi:hypothetical protein